jgi:integrase
MAHTKYSVQSSAGATVLDQASLSADDLQTLQHLVAEGTPANSQRALTSDLRYLEAWHDAVAGAPLPWPAPEGVVAKFIAHHLFDPVERERTPSHGMPREIEHRLRGRGVLAATLPHRPSTVARRLATWRTLHRVRDCGDPWANGRLGKLMAKARRARGGLRTPKSAVSLVRPLLEGVLAAIDTQALLGLRDRAMLATAFAAGGRRRSEIVDLQHANIRVLEEDPGGPSPQVQLRFARTKTQPDGHEVVIAGRPASFLLEWLAASSVETGAVFRSADSQGRLLDRGLSPAQFNRIVKARAKAAGVEPSAVSAHGLRSGFMTQASHDHIPLAAAMAQSAHRDVKAAIGYYQDRDRRDNPSTTILM